MTYPALPAAYRWLLDIAATEGPLPRMIDEALKLVGTVEVPGAGNNVRILEWAKETGLGRIYTADSIPWCGLFMAVVALRSAKPVPSSPLWALSWSKFGVDAGQPRLGDVLTFVREGGGHVALYIGEDPTTYHILGGNQGDRVGFTRIAKSRLYRVRRPAYRVAPATAEPHILTAGGAISTNEA